MNVSSLLNNRFIERVKQTPTAQRVMDEIHREEIAQRQALIEQLQELAGGKDDTMKPLVAARDKAQAKVDRLEKEMKEAYQELRERIGEVTGRDSAIDTKIAKLKAELERTAPDSLTAFIDELGETLQQLRKDPSPSDISQARYQRIREIRAEATALLHTDCADIDTQLNKLRQRLS